MRRINDPPIRLICERNTDSVSSLRRAKPIEKRDRYAKFFEGRKESKFSFGSSLSSNFSLSGAYVKRLSDSSDSMSSSTGITGDSKSSHANIKSSKIMPMLEPIGSSLRYKYSSCQTSSFYSSMFEKRDSQEDGFEQTPENFESFCLKPISFSPLRIWDAEKCCFVNQMPRSRSEHRKFTRSRSGSSKRNTVDSVSRKVDRLTNLIGKIKKEIDVHEITKKKLKFHSKQLTKRSRSLDSRQVNLNISGNKLNHLHPLESDDSAKTFPKIQPTEKSKIQWKEFQENFSSLVKFLKPKANENAKTLPDRQKKNSICSLSTDFENELNNLVFLCGKQNTSNFAKISESSSCNTSQSGISSMQAPTSGDMLESFANLEIQQNATLNSDSALERTFDSSQIITTTSRDSTTSISTENISNSSSSNIFTEHFTEKQKYQNLPSTSEDDDPRIEQELKINSAFNPNLRKMHLEITNQKKELEKIRKQEKSFLSEKLILQRTESLAQQKQFRSKDIFTDPSFASTNEILMFGATGHKPLSRFRSHGNQQCVGPTVTFV